MSKFRIFVLSTISTICLMDVTYVKHTTSVRPDFEHVHVAMGNSYANVNAEMDLFLKFKINVA